MKSTLIETLHVEALEPPLNLRTEYLAKNNHRNADKNFLFTKMLKYLKYRRPS